MKITASKPTASIELNHLAGIQITRENCDEVYTESMELMKLAMNIKFEKMKSEALSMQIKRGLAFKREQAKKLEVTQ